MGWHPRASSLQRKASRRLYSRTGDDISAAFPRHRRITLISMVPSTENYWWRAAVHSCRRSPRLADLQQRLNRKTVSKQMLQSHPAFIRAYDVMQAGAEDLRSLPFVQRREALMKLTQRLDPARFDISPLLDFSTWDDLAALRANPPHAIIEGVMLKRKDSPYLSGRVKSPWYKWKRDPRVIDAVLIYAQRGHGKRSGFYSDYTFGVWTETGELAPVGKAYFGFTDEGIAQDRQFYPQQYSGAFRAGAAGAGRARPWPGF